MVIIALNCSILNVHCGKVVINHNFRIQKGWDTSPLCEPWFIWFSVKIFFKIEKKSMNQNHKNQNVGEPKMICSQQ